MSISSELVSTLTRRGVILMPPSALCSVPPMTVSRRTDRTQDAQLGKARGKHPPPPTATYDVSPAGKHARSAVFGDQRRIAMTRAVELTSMRSLVRAQY